MNSREEYQRKNKERKRKQKNKIRSFEKIRTKKKEKKGGKIVKESLTICERKKEKRKKERLKERKKERTKENQNSFKEIEQIRKKNEKRE